MTPNASTLKVTPNLHRVLQASHGLQYIFGDVLLAMHYIQCVSDEEVLHIQKPKIVLVAYDWVCNKVKNKQLVLRL